MLRKKSFLRKKKHLRKNTMSFFNENTKAEKTQQTKDTPRRRRMMTTIEK